MRIHRFHLLQSRCGKPGCCCVAHGTFPSLSAAILFALIHLDGRFEFPWGVYDVLTQKWVRRDVVQMAN